MTKEDFIAVCSDYIGTFKTDRNEIQFVAVNHLVGYYQDGTIWKQGNIECFLETDGTNIGGGEKTYSIIGGFGGDTLTMDNLLYYLNKYCFKKKKEKDTQLSLFELL